MPKTIYCQEIKEHPEFKSLYYRFGGSSELKKGFDDFLEFFEWSLDNGYEPGAKLRRKDEGKPWNPDNLYWKAPDVKIQPFFGEEQKEAIEKWNKTVNRIRVHYGLEPF